MIAFRFAVSTIFIAVLLLGAQKPAYAQADADCVEDLQVAQSAYFNGEFDRVIELLQPCIEGNAFENEEAQSAYTLFGRTQFVLGETDAAETAIQQLFLVNPEYSPDPQFPPNFISFIDDVKQGMIAEGSFPSDEPETEEPEILVDTPPITDVEPVEDIQEERKKRKNLLLIGGGAAIAVAGVTAAILSGGGSGGDPPTTSGWPLPPGRP